MSLIGTWALVSMRHRLDGRVWSAPALSEGRLTYTADGMVSVLIVIADVDGRFATHPASDELVAYAGRYVLDGATVRHHIEVCARPGWVGRTQVRIARLSEDVLHLRTVPYATSAGRRESEMSWRRVPLEEAVAVVRDDLGEDGRSG